MVKAKWAALAQALLIGVVATSAAAQTPAAGSIRGVVSDKEFDAPVGKATISVLGTKTRVTANDSGAYVISGLAPGTYTIVVTKDGFTREVKANIVVCAGQLIDADIRLAGDFEEMDEFVVQDVEVETKQDLVPVELNLPPLDFQLNLRLESPQILDTVGVEFFTKSGASDAAAALLLVPGATLQDGKYAVIRGLPDRYVSTLLDGVRLPSADPDKRAVKLDQFPAAVIKSLDISKTFTPDQQGDSSGGAVNIVLKDLPEEGFFQFKSQVGFNSQVKDGSFLTYPGGGMDYWGGQTTLSTHPEASGTTWPNNPTGTTTGSAPIIYKWSVAGGDTWEVDDGVKFGVFGSFFYDQDASYFDNGVENSMIQEGSGTALVPEQFQGSGGVGDSFKTQLLDVTQGTQSIQWGGIGIIGLETDNLKLSGKYLYTLLSEQQSVLAVDTRGKDYYFPGYNVNDPLSPGNDVGNLGTAPWNRLETLDYSQMSTETFIFSGQYAIDFFGAEESHYDILPNFLTPVIDWRLSLSQATETQPDQTQFGSIWTPNSEIPIPPFPPIVIPNQWGIYPPSENINLGWVQHINYYNAEDSQQGALNIKLPFVQWNDREGYVKAGMFLDYVNRSYSQETFSNSGGGASGQTTTFEAPWEQPWSAEFPSQFHPIFQSTYDIDYTGAQDISAYYAMMDLPFAETMNFVAGVRFENTTMTTTVDPDVDATWIDIANNGQTPIAFDPAEANLYNASFTVNSVLPMIGWNWSIRDDLVLRAAFAQTIARPNFYELVPVQQYDFLGGPIFIGNPGLGMSSLNNYDIRLDWTPEQDWLISGSFFYKQINDPIQYVQRFAGFEYTTAINMPSGHLYGVELESRITLEPFLGEEFAGFGLGANATLMDSVVELDQYDIDQYAIYGSNETTQPMTATPNYLLNLNATYDNDEWGTSVGLFYNLQGESLISGSTAYTVDLVPAVYQLSYGTLNFTASQEVIDGLRIYVAAKNLTNPEIQTQYRTADGVTALQSSYTAGISCSLGLSYKVEF